MPSSGPITHGSSLLKVFILGTLLIVLGLGLYLLTAPSPLPPPIDDSPSLVMRQDLIPLPPPITRPLNSRPDYALRANQTLSSALTALRDHYTFRIIVFAWKRRASLKRLLDSLNRTDYHGLTVHMDFHMDGGAHPKVTQFVDSFKWPHGRIRINRYVERVGLEKTIMDSWKPVNDTEFAFFFEDDIEVSPRFFEYSIVALAKYVLPSGRRAAPSVWNERFVGISLYTPRYNEISIPHVEWNPEEEIGSEEDQFLFQLPCSWGALYVPWRWREFLEFYSWRRMADGWVLNASIRDSYTKFWRRSWKKFLIEFMYMRGQFLLYPNLPRQLSFSTHHREPGEHTKGKPEEPLVDDLGSDGHLDYFTVPLLSDADQGVFEKLLAEMKPLRELSIVSYHHERVSDIHRLSQLGLYTLELMEENGWSNLNFTINPTCILDGVTFPVLRRDITKERFLIYEPQMSLSHQVNALQNAMAWAKILGRTLVLPPFRIEDDSGKKVSIGIDQIFDNMQPLSGVTTIPLETFLHDNEIYWIDRQVTFIPWALRKNESTTFNDDIILNSYGLFTAGKATIHVIPTTDEDILTKFNGCHDQFLTFRHMTWTFSNFIKEDDQSSYTRWLSKGLLVTPNIQKLIDHVEKGLFSTPLACVAISHGDVPEECGWDIAQLKEQSIEQKLVRFRSCIASPQRILEYVISDANHLKLQLSSIYLISDMVDLPVEMKAKQNGKVVPIYTKKDLIEMILASKYMEQFPYMKSLVGLIEEEICTRAALYLGNKYWTLSNRITLKRGKLPTNTLGEKIKKD